MRNLVIISAALVLAACSSIPISSSQSQPVGSAQVFEPELQSKSTERTVPVVLVRDGGFVNSFFGAIVVVDGKNAVTIKPKERFAFFLSPGNHVLSVRSAKSPESSPMAVTNIEVRPNTPTHIDLRLVKAEGPRITWSLQTYDESAN